jgi:hypothetical protein
MQRISRLACVVTIGAFALVSCGGSDGDAGSTGTNGNGTTAGTQTESTDGNSGTVDPNATIGNVPGLSEECTDFYNKYIAAMGSIGTGAANGVSSIFTSMKDILPDELKDDAEIVAAAWVKYEAVLSKYDNDMTKAMADPDAVAALEAIGDDKVNEASNAIGDYFSDTCPTG